MAQPDAWYVYGFVEGGAAAPDTAAILPDSAVEAVPIGTIPGRRLAALASRVGRRLFDRADPARRTADPDWMAERVQAYHAVNAAAAAAGPFLPLAFGAVFSTLDRLAEWLAPQQAAVEAALRQVAGHAEWALSLQAEAATQSAWLERHDPALCHLAAAIAAAGAGTGFLLARRRDKTLEGARAREIAAAAAAIEAVLDDTAPTVLADAPRAGLPSWSVLAPLPVADGSAGWPDRLRRLAADWEPRGRRCG